MNHSGMAVWRSGTSNSNDAMALDLLFNDPGKAPCLNLRDNVEHVKLCPDSSM